ncbi:helix-turn-helix domain-containing protein [Leifsonia sp. SIMBA_070]|uniref:helix-turn-helix domain-containing protein n=1 Tax=Leifsonia sp. SIMBA_070 TaxID=3085810 RepID=UPI003979C428
MDNLDEALGVVNSPGQRRADALVASDMQMLRRLVELRENQGLSQEQVAARLGISQPAIAAFERYDNDPKLSTIRRYAHAIGALISHHVTLDDGRSSETSNASASAIRVDQGTFAHVDVPRSSSNNSSSAWRGELQAVPAEADHK